MLDILKFRPGDAERRKLMKTVKAEEEGEVIEHIQDYREQEKDVIIINSEIQNLLKDLAQL
jgi:3-dehydroquinate dehydratase